MKIKQPMKLLAGLMTAGVMSHGASAASLILTNSDIATPGAGGLWSNSANWLGGVAPGAADIVVLSNSVPSLAGVTSASNGGYYTYIKGLAPDAGVTNVFDGTMPVTSIVDAYTIGGLWVNQTNAFNNWAVGNQMSEGAHNIYITNRLNIVSSTPRYLYQIYSNTVAIGTGFDNTNSLVYTTIQGPGSLNVTNPVGCMWVGQGSQTAGVAATTHAAVLDMSGLSTFNCVLSNICIATDFNPTNSASNPFTTGYARPQGILILAQTNYITLLDTNSPALILGFENNNNGTSFCVSNLLGKVNYLNFDQMVIGGPKTSSSVAGMYFTPILYGASSLPGSGTPALTDGYAKFRNIDGVSRQSAWVIGDDALSLGTTTTAYGNVNFNRGSVDALVDTIYLARGGVPTITTATAVGTLIYGAGTTNQSIIDVNQVEMADMLNLTAPGQGNLTLYSNATMNVNNYLRMINVVAGGTLGTCRAIVSVYGGNLNIAGSILNNPVLGSGGGNSTLFINYGGKVDMRPNPAKPAGNITLMTLSLNNGILTNFTTLSVSNLVVNPPYTTFALGSGQALSPAGTYFADALTIGYTNTTPGTNIAQLDGTSLVNNGNGLVGLSLNNSALIMDIGTSSDSINVNGGITLAGVNQIYVNPVAGFGPGTYSILTYNTNTAFVDYSGNPNYGLTGNVASQLVAGGPITNSSYSISFDASTPGVIKMIVSASAPTSLNWVGDGSANAWDVVGANNWNNGSGVSKFYQFDTVNFTDSGSATPAVNLNTTVYPAAVNMSSSQNYTLSGLGQITGIAALTKSGTGTLTVLSTNSFTGGTTISGGTVKLGNGVSTMGTIGSGAISAGGTLAVDVLTNQIQILTNNISGTGSITAEGPGEVMLAGANTSFTGTVKVTGGTLAPVSLPALSYGATPSAKLIYVTNSGTLDINGLALSNNIIISGAGVNGAGALVNNGASQSGANMQVTMTGDAAIGGNFRMDINNIVTNAPGNLTGNGYNLTKVGTNCVSLYNSATNLWTNGLGNITVNAGVLRLQNGTVLGVNPAKTLTVASNATFELNNVWLAAPVKLSGILQDGSCLYGTGGVSTNIYGPFSYVQGNVYSGSVSLNGTDVFDTSTNSVLVVNGVVSGGGNLVKGIGYHPTSATTAFSTGTGTLVLGAPETFTGNLVVQTGTVVLTNTASVKSAASIALAGGVVNAALRTDGTLTISSNQTISGVGSVVGNLVVPTNGIIAPGNPTGLLTNLGSTTLLGTNNMTISKTNGIISYSQLGASGTLSLGGTLNVNYTGTGLTNGDTFQLFSAPTITGAFTTVNLPTGATWTNRTAIDGTIVVLSVSTEPSTPPTLATVLTGNSLSLSWPTTYSSYVLQAQTNSVSVGLSTNWVTVPTSGNTITVPINPNNGSVFYRLKK